MGSFMVRNCGRGGCGWDGVHNWEENKRDCRDFINLTQVAHFQGNIFMRNCIRPK